MHFRFVPSARQAGPTGAHPLHGWPSSRTEQEREGDGAQTTGSVPMRKIRAVRGIRGLTCSAHMMNPRLNAISGPRKGLVILITAIEVTIGRAADNGVV